ncbi:MAG: glycosyltransferase [Candidatus Diapherotrites archaeon]
MKSKKIALVFPYAEPETGAPIARIDFFRRVLEGNGFEIKVLAPQKPDVKETGEVLRFKGKIGLFNALRKEKPALAIASGPPAQAIFDTALFSKILGFPAIADARDPWVKAKVTLGILDEGSLKWRLQKKFEKTAYSLSKKIFAISPAVAWEIEALGVSKGKIRIIEHSADTNAFRKDLKAGKEVRKELGIGKRPMLVYVGGAWVGIETMVEKISWMLKEKNAFLLLALSKSAFDPEQMFEKIREAVEKGGAGKNVKIMFNVQHGELFRYLSAADIGLNIIPEKLNYVVSNKVKEYMACGLPVSCKCDPECYSKEFIEGQGIGIVSGSWKEFAKKTSALIGSEKLGKLGKKALEASKSFSHEKIGKKVLEEIEGIL